MRFLLDNKVIDCYGVSFLVESEESVTSISGVPNFAIQCS